MWDVRKVDDKGTTLVDVSFKVRMTRLIPTSHTDTAVAELKKSIIQAALKELNGGEEL